MNKREKMLAAGTGLVAVGFFAYLALHRVFIVPAREARQQTVVLQEKIQRALGERGKEKTYLARFRQLAALTYGEEDNRISDRVRSRLTEVLTQSGLSAISLKPTLGSRVPGVYREIGWIVRTRGKLANIINLLYLLGREPHLHRLDNLVLTPVPGGQDLDLQMKYATLVLDPPKGEKLLTDQVPPDAAPTLEGPERVRFEVIAYRDLFRPYMPAPPRPSDPPREPPAPRAPTPPTAPRVPESRYRVVGLPTWGGQTDVLVRDVASGKVANYRVGDEVAGGKIVMVDYRPLPRPNKPEILSLSRIVLQVGTDYFAVELGASLGEKHAIAPEHWPPGLPKPQPAAPETPAPPVGAPPQTR